jgi:hypothetical protein
LGRGGRHAGQLGILGTQVKACRFDIAGGSTFGAPQYISRKRPGNASNCTIFNVGTVFAVRSCRQIVTVLERGGSMDPKLAILFLLFGGVIGLSHLNDENIDRVRRQLVVRRWREFVPGRHKS